MLGTYDQILLIMMGDHKSLETTSLNIIHYIRLYPTKGIKTSSKSPRGSCFREHFHFEFLSAFPLPLAGAVLPSQKPGGKKKKSTAFSLPFSHLFRFPSCSLCKKVEGQTQLNNP